MNATPKRVELPVEPVPTASAPESVLAAKLAAVEAQLADAEEILGDALQSSSSWIWESDENHCFTRIIGPIEALLGTRPEKLIGKKVEDFTRASQDPSVQNHFNTIQQRKPYRDVVTPINTPKGVRFVKASGKPLYDAAGKFLGYRGTAGDVTEQVQTERRANESNRRFMEAIENVPASLMLCDREDRIVFCNSATQRYFPTAAHLLIPGTKYEELLRAHAASGVVAEIGKDFEGWIQKRMRSHRSGNTNIVRSYSDGRWSQIVERRTSDGGIIGVRLDITQLKKREKELQEVAAKLRHSQDHLERAQRISRTGSDERNLLTGEAEWSDTTYEIFGVSRESFVPTYANFLSMVHPDDRHICLEVRDAIEAGKTPKGYEYRIVRSDGQVRTIYRETVVKSDEHGKPIGYTGTLRDVTELRAAEDAIRQKTREIEGRAAELQRSNAELQLREKELQELNARMRISQEHLAQAQRISHIGSVERDLKTGVVKWSEENCRLFDWDPAKPPPQRREILKLIHPDDRAKYEASMLASEQGLPSEPITCRIIRVNGEMRWIYVEAAVLLDPDGTPARRLVTYQDITAVHEASEELKRSNAELEQFAYVASHDLQEPLRMVASYCQLLQRRYKDKLDGDANEFIGFAVEGANRMQRLINDLLGYSRIGRQGGNPENFRAADALKTVLANLQGAISESGAKIEFNALPDIRADRTQVSQLFQNLIGNAIKFRRDGETPLIRISATLEGEFWHFLIEDNGIGIEKDYLERVFLIFQRLHERHKYPGTGIGLAIVKKVIEHHGGRIWVESTLGQGSKFHFTLPAASKTERV